jgi:large subunit ribosomal protein L24|nr:50S ribosomal protein L24 [Kofleriaceae bacterium]
MARQLHIRKGDLVIVISGSNKGKRGKVLRVEGERVVIEKVAMIKRHQKPTQQNPQGGIVDREGTVHVSNVQLFDDKAGRGTRSKIVNENGVKTRVGVKTGTKFATSGM